MKKLLLLLLLPFLLMACKENENGGEDEEEEPTYPVELQGTWRSVYSKTIYPAEMVNGEPVGIGDYRINEYFGGFPAEDPYSGAFNSSEYKIKLDEEYIYIYIYEDYNIKTIRFKLQYDMEEKTILEHTTTYHYSLENDTLTVIRYPQNYYVISNYVKTNEN